MPSHQPNPLALMALALAASSAFPPSALADGGLLHDGNSFLVAEGRRPSATLVISDAPTFAARLGALEAQTHVWRITGAVLPIVADTQPVTGNRILVGESQATRELGLMASQFDPQEYLVRVRHDTVVLMGRDWIDTPENRDQAGMSSNAVHIAQTRNRIDYAAVTGTTGLDEAADRGDVELPGLFDDQGSCYAVYDFLERQCGVRWYGPSESNVVIPASDTLRVPAVSVRRSPAFSHREALGNAASVWPLNNGLWDAPSADALHLYARRMREAGDRWAANHSLVYYRDRFLAPDEAGAKGSGWTMHPELFEAAHPEYFGVGAGPGEGQYCYTNEAFIQQVAQDARDFFDGKGIKGDFAPSMGDYFAVVPGDNNTWCQCDNCQAELALSAEQRTEHFSNGRASRYLFGFVNKVAREVAKTHPDKYIATLAYWDYAYYPEGMEMEPNVSISPCLQTRIYWAPFIERNDIETFYRPWADMAKERPMYLWLYGCFPEENALGGGYNCFPGFMAHTAARNIRMYHEDDFRGIFFCGYGEQVDYYVGMKLLDDPARDVDDLLDEFFSLYYGAAAEPMKRLYLRIEAIYSDAANYPEAVRTEERQFHQNEEIAWGYLGTEERMAGLGALVEEARALASTPMEKKRVGLFDTGVWQYMLAGREQYVAKQSTP